MQYQSLSTVPLVALFFFLLVTNVSVFIPPSSVSPACLCLYNLAWGETDLNKKTDQNLSVSSCHAKNVIFIPVLI